MVQKPGDKAPNFENKIPKELWQQVEETLKLAERADRKMKLKRKLEYVAEADKGKVTVTLPFTEGQQRRVVERPVVQSGHGLLQPVRHGPV